MALRRTPMSRGTKPLTRKAPPRARKTPNGPDNGGRSGPFVSGTRHRQRDTVVDAPPVGGADATVPETENRSGTRLDLAAAGAALARQAASAAAPPRVHAPVPEVSKRAPKPSDTGFTAPVKALIFTRDRGTCWRCGRDVTVLGWNTQHRDNRGMGGTSDPRINWPSNGIVLCGSGTTGCHGWVEHHEHDAARMGWVVKGWAAPETVPVRHITLGWFLIDRHGARWPCPAPPGNDAHTAAARKEDLS